MFHSPEPAFGQALVEVDDELAAFGCRETADHTCFLARVPFEEVFDRGAWRFWNGEAYVAELDDAAPLFEGHTMLTVHYNQHARAWLAIYSEPLGSGVLMRNAPSLEGPWSPPETVFGAQVGHDGSPPYAALGHSEYRRMGGAVEYITYYRSTGDWSGELRLVEIQLRAP